MHRGRYRLEYWEKLCLLAYPAVVKDVPARCNFEVDALWGWVAAAQDRNGWRDAIKLSTAKVLASM